MKSLKRIHLTKIKSECSWSENAEVFCGKIMSAKYRTGKIYKTTCNECLNEVKILTTNNRTK